MPVFTKNIHELDLERFKEHISWLIDEGLVDGRGILMGGSGQSAAYLMTREQHESTMKALVDAANGRVPTMTGIFDISTDEAVRRAKMAADIGVDFIQVAPPHYLPPVDEEIYYHYRAINDNSDCGIMVYNTPWSSQFDMKPKLISKLIELENVTAFKWTSYSAVNLLSVLKEFSNKTIIMDNSTQLASSLAFQLGAKAWVTFFGNISPKFELHLYDLILAKKYDIYEQELKKIRAWRIFQSDPADMEAMAREVGEHVDFYGLGEGSITTAVFEAIGRPIGPPLPPQKIFSKEEVATIRRILEKTNALDPINEYAQGSVPVASS